MERMNVYKLFLFFIIFSDHFSVHFSQTVVGDDWMFSNDTNRRKMQEFVQLCPYTSTCNVSALVPNITGSTINREICCAVCSCNSECGVNCCPDRSVDFRIIKEEMYNAKVIRCIDAQYRPFSEGVFNGRSVTMVSKCPIRNNNKDISRKCEKGYEDMKFDIPLRYILPLYDEVTGLIYKNTFCAQCHNASVSILTFADITIECFNYQELNLTYIRDIENLKDGCNVLFAFPSSIEHEKRCDRTLINRCNVTGLWLEYDIYLEAACVSYKSVFIQKYKNVHCALCNGMPESKIESTCRFNDTQSERELGITISFISYIDWNVPMRDTARQDCIQSALLNPSKRTEWELHCPNGMKLEKSMCTFVHQETPLGLIIEMNIALHPKNFSKDQSNVTVEKVLSNIINDIGKRISLLISKDVEFQYAKGFLSFTKDFKNFHPRDIILNTHSVESVAIKVHMFVKHFYRKYFGTVLDFALVFTDMSYIGDFTTKFQHFDNISLSDARLSYSDNCTRTSEVTKIVICYDFSKSTPKELRGVFEKSCERMLFSCTMCTSCTEIPVCINETV